MKAISKKEFIEAMAKHHKTSKVDAENSLKAVTETLGKMLAKGQKVLFPGFGSFYVLQTKARTGRNPKTGQPLKIKASKRVGFRAGAKLKELVS